MHYNGMCMSIPIHEYYFVYCYATSKYRLLMITQLFVNITQNDSLWLSVHWGPDWYD